MKKLKYSIGLLEFSSIKQCENYTRNILKNLGFTKIYKNNNHFNFIHDLLKNHNEYNEKVGLGIDYFEIKPNRLNKNPELYIHRVDNTDVIFSWRYCCSLKSRDYLCDAMRSSISKDIIQFKKSSKLTCNLCNIENLPFGEFHIDHNKNSFHSIYKKFMEVNTLKIPTIFQRNNFNTCEFMDNDYEFKKNWIEFHNKNCDLQVLCKSCNLKKRQ